MSHSITSGASSKLRIIDENTFNQFRQNNETPIKKYKKCRQMPNLGQFISSRYSHKKIKRKPIVYSIYKIKKKSVKKSKTKKSSKLKKCILQYRLLKRTQIKENQNSDCDFLPGIVDKFENLSLQQVSHKKHSVVHSRRFREYCDNTTSQELNNLVETLLRKLNHFQKRAFKINNYKGKSRRRIVIGFREVQVQMKIDKIKCVIIATDCEKCDFEDGLDNIILQIKDNCRNADIPCVFALHRRKLSYALHQKCPTSCVGIVDYDGAQDSFMQMLNILEIEKSNYSLSFSLPYE